MVGRSHVNVCHVTVPIVCLHLHVPSPRATWQVVLEVRSSFQTWEVVDVYLVLSSPWHLFFTPRIKRQIP